MSRPRSVCTLALWAAVVAGSAPLGSAGEPLAPGASEWKVDHRYAPVWWQTSICLPDDWQKTLVGKEGTLLYDYPGRFSDFKTRIGLSFEPVDRGTGKAEWLRQELLSPRVPIVRTLKRVGQVEVLEEAFAVAPLVAQEPSTRKSVPPAVERVDGGGGQKGWANPTLPCDPAFRDVAIGWNDTIRYRVRAPGKERVTIVLGLCEGWHRASGQRVLDLKIEGKTRKTVDVVVLYGWNFPVLFPFEARDENGDGFIDVAVAAAPGSRDKNTILNVLWVFKGDAPPLSELPELLSGKSTRPALAHVNCGLEPPVTGPPRHDVLLVRLHNRGPTPASLVPVVTIDSELELRPEVPRREVSIGPVTRLMSTAPFAVAKQGKENLVLRLEEVTIPAGAERWLALGTARGTDARPLPGDVAAAKALRASAEKFWQEVDLPYGRIEVPDPGIQAQLDSSIRNIYQAREIKQGLPAFQVGPTCYRGLWVVDGSFLLESVAFLGRTDEARNGIRYLLGFQRDDGAIMIMDGHLKETGIAFWAVARHARLTNDKAWLRDVWPQIEKGFQYIRTLRQKASADPKAPIYRLLPEGFSDGGLGGTNPEYTNVYWTLVGLKAAVDAARWLGRTDQADAWQREYDDFYATFRRAAERDTRTDPSGNRYVPICMRADSKISPQKAQWAFLHAVFPGKVLAADDPLVRGNMAMLRAVEAEGLVRDTGWVANGVWNYFASFYAHGWLWLGDGQKAAKTLYAFANHASPLLCWREEQMPKGEGPAICGDMPHNWGSAEFIRLVRHLLVLERGDELHLFEGLPPAWLRPGKSIRVVGAPTEFGPISLELKVSSDGSEALLTVDPPQRNPPKRIVLHRGGWSGAGGTVELPASGKIEQKIPLGTPPRN